MKDFFNGDYYVRVKLTPELLEDGILDIIVKKEPREIVVSYKSQGRQKTPVTLRVLEFPYSTVDQLDTLVNDSMTLETLTDLKGHIILKLGPQWSQIYVSDSKAEQEENGKEEKKNKIQAGFTTLKQIAHNLFVDEYKIPYIAIQITDHLELFPINSKSFENWYRMFIFERDGTALDNQTINDICSLASAYAASLRYGTQINLGLRCSKKDKKEWFYDLTNNKWEFVRVTPNGWHLDKDEIIFRRYSNQMPQVYPDSDYESDIFDRFINLLNIQKDDKDCILLLKVYIVSLFIPEIQKVILIVQGSQGSAKTSLQELIKMLVDPSILKTLTFPRNLTELIQQLSHNYINYYDNVSLVNGWISDQLCRAVSGSGSSTRKLYTDDDDVIRSFKRCIGFNGINIATTRADLLDRSIITRLGEIEKGKRMTPEGIWNEFELLRPKLLGYIFDILVKVLVYERNNPNEKLKLYRMTEFSKYGEIIARCMGYRRDEFIQAYERNREIQIDEVIESNQVAIVLMHMMFEKYSDLKEWDGTPTALYGEVKSIVETDAAREHPELNIDTKDRYFPKKANALSRRLNEIKPTLKEKGLEIIHYQEKDQRRTRKIKMIKISSEPSEGQIHAQNLDNFADDTLQVYSIPSTIPSENNPQNCAQNSISDDMDDMDDTLHTIKGEIDRNVTHPNEDFREH